MIKTSATSFRLSIIKAIKGNAPKYVRFIYWPALIAFFLTSAHSLSDTLGIEEYYHDSFYFIGRHDSSNTAYYFSFKRKRNTGSTTQLIGNFDGVLNWKNNWFFLEPQKYDINIFEKTIFPPHPAFDFKWPTEVEDGEFLYNFGHYYLSLVFKTFQPLYRVINTLPEKSEFFIANAVLQGQTNVINGILLYHRLRFERAILLKSNETIDPKKREGPSKLIFLNGVGGESYIIWTNNPYPGKLETELAIRISYQGEVLATEREVDYAVIDSDIKFVPRLQKAWKLSIPGLQTIINLSTISYSPRIENSRYYAVDGVIKFSTFERTLNGLLIDIRSKTESDLMVMQEAQDRSIKVIKKKKNRIIKLKRKFKRQTPE